MNSEVEFFQEVFFSQVWYFISSSNSLKILILPLKCKIILSTFEVIHAPSILSTLRITMTEDSPWYSNQICYDLNHEPITFS